MAANEGEIQGRLQELQKQLAKKQMFEGSVSEIRSLLQHHYSSASPNLRKTVCVSDFTLFFFFSLFWDCMNCSGYGIWCYSIDGSSTYGIKEKMQF